MTINRHAQAREKNNLNEVYLGTAKHNLGWGWVGEEEIKAMCVVSVRTLSVLFHMTRLVHCNFSFQTWTRYIVLLLTHYCFWRALMKQKTSLMKCVPEPSLSVLKPFFFCFKVEVCCERVSIFIPVFPFRVTYNNSHLQVFGGMLPRRYFKLTSSHLAWNASRLESHHTCTWWLFQKFIWEQFGTGSPCPSSVTLPRQPLFDWRLVWIGLRHFLVIFSLASRLQLELWKGNSKTHVLFSCHPEMNAMNIRKVDQITNLLS